MRYVVLARDIIVFHTLFIDLFSCCCQSSTRAKTSCFSRGFYGLKQEIRAHTVRYINSRSTHSSVREEKIPVCIILFSSFLLKPDILSTNAHHDSLSSANNSTDGTVMLKDIISHFLTRATLGIK